MLPDFIILSTNIHSVRVQRLDAIGVALVGAFVIPKPVIMLGEIDPWCGAA
jgi:hypothetical protein